jgi:hypothetical protein
MATTLERRTSVGTYDDVCDHFGDGAPTVLPLQVLYASAPYLGTCCPTCGPYNRKSEDLANPESATALLHYVQAGGRSPLMR